MRNAVAKLNDLLKFDEFYLPYKGVTIPCWILSTLQGGNNTLMNFIYPTRGSWLWTLWWGRLSSVSKEIALMQFSKRACFVCLFVVCSVQNSLHFCLSFLILLLLLNFCWLIDSHKNFAHQKRFWSNRFTCTGSATNLIYLSRGWQILDEFPLSWTRRSRSEIEEGEIVKPPWMIEWWRASKTSMNDWMQEGELVKPPWMIAKWRASKTSMNDWM